VADPTELATRKLYDLIRHLQANALDTRNLRALLKELQAVKKALDAAHATP